MSSIPDDIMHEARMVMYSLRGELYAEYDEHNVPIVARALLAATKREQERCALIAKSLLSTERRDNGACAYYSNVERAILKGEP